MVMFTAANISAASPAFMSSRSARTRSAAWNWVTAFTPWPRTASLFSIRDRVLFDLLAPRLEDLIVDGRRQHDRQSLSACQLQVLRLVAESASHAEVSAQLSVSVATVRKHLEHVYLKLGVRNRTAAARVLGSGGSLPLDPSVRAAADGAAGRASEHV